MQNALELADIDALREGAPIANANGIPGTLGCLALTRDENKLVFLSSYHVLFGAGAQEQDVVWANVHHNRRPIQCIARTRHGRCCTVTYGGTDIFVDCATAELDRRFMSSECRIVADVREATLLPGDRVLKLGAATGRTEGVVLDTDHSDTVRLEGRRYTTPNQILIKPSIPGDIFSNDGDSGAVLRNVDGVVVGLLWGVDARGYGLASPIAPVLWVLHLRLAYFALKEAS